MGLSNAQIISKAMSLLGSRKSKKKADAVRENGKKGGRPPNKKGKTPMHSSMKNVIIALIGFFLIATATLVYRGELAARRGAAQIPSIEIVP